MPTININMTNRQLIDDLRQAMRELESEHQHLVDSYHALIGQWEGDTDPPLKNAEGSIEFFKHLGYIQKGIDGLRDQINNIQPKLL